MGHKALGIVAPGVVRLVNTKMVDLGLSRSYEVYTEVLTR